MNTELRTEINDFMNILTRQVLETNHYRELFNILSYNRLNDIPFYCLLHDGVNLEGTIEVTHERLNSLLVNTKEYKRDPEPKMANGLVLLKKLTNNVLLENGMNEGTLNQFIQDCIFITDGSYFGIHDNNHEHIAGIIHELHKFPWLFILIMMENIVITE